MSTKALELAQLSSTLAVDGTSGSVGISAPLDLNSDLIISDKIVHTGDTNTAIRFPANDTVTVETNGAERLRITATGNVGIGTTGPTTLLQVAAPVGTGSQDIFRVSSAAGGSFQIRCDDLAAANPSWTLFTNASEPMAFAVAATEAMRITPTGFVGIGTTNPQSELDVFGAGDIIRSTANNGSSNFMAFFDATGRKGYFGYGGATEDMTLSNDRSGFLRFITNGSTRATITSSGDLGLGTISPTERLHVSGNIIASGSSSTTKNILRTTSGQIEVRAGDNVSFLDTDFNEAASVAVAARFFRNTNTTGAKTVRFHRGDGTAAEDARIAVGIENTFFGLGGGSVGVGKIPSTGIKLDVKGKVNLEERLTVDFSGSGSLFIGDGASSSTSNRYIAFYNDDGLRLQTRTDAGVFVSDDYRITTGAAGALTHEWCIGNTERMRIDSAGNVGIGTSSPSEKLTVVGNGVFGDATTKYNTVTINGGHVGDGGNDYGLTIRAFEPAITMLDRSTGAGSSQIFGLSNGGILLRGDTTNDGTIGHNTNTTDFALAQFEPSVIRFFTGGSESVRIGSSGDVGIGTTNPLTPIHVVRASHEFMRLQNTTAGGGSGYISFYETGGTRVAWIGTSSSSNTNLQIANQSATGVTIFSTNDTERMRIDSAGNVGIGTSSPEKTLTVAAAAALDGSNPATIQIRSTASSSGWTAGAKFATLDFYSDDSSGASATARTRWQLAATNVTSSGYASDFVIYGDDSNAATPTLVERLRIDASGNVGIGTSSPVAKLNVVGGSDSDAVRITQTGAGNALVVEDASSTDSTPFVIDSDGRVINGHTTSLVVGGSQQSEQIHGAGGNGISLGRFENNAFGSDIRFFKSRSGTIGGFAIVQNGDTLGNINFFGDDGLDSSRNLQAASIRSSVDGTPNEGSIPGRLTFHTMAAGSASASERMRITSAGEVMIAGSTDRGAYNLQCNGTGVWGAGAYVNGSDERLKEEIADLANASEVVAQLRPVTFRYKQNYSKDQSVQPGFIAQELQAALAEQVYVDGVVQAGPQYLNVAYQALVPVLTKALQEALTKIEALEARLAAANL